MNMKRLILSLAFGVIVAGTVGSSAAAQDVQITGPLAGAPACRNCRIYREGRIHLEPFAAFTLQDEFSRAMIFGMQMSWHPTDWLGLTLIGGHGTIHLDTGLTDEVGQQGQTTERNAVSLPSRDYFSDQVGTIDWMAGGQVTFIPLRGKLALFQKAFVDTDFYVFGGVMAVGVGERADVPAGTCSRVPPGGATPATDPCVETQTLRSARVAIAPTFGAGLSLFMNDFLALTFEWRGLPFSWNTSGTDEGCAEGEAGCPSSGFPDEAIDENDRIFHFNHMVKLGFSVYLPTAAGIGE